MKHRCLCVPLRKALGNPNAECATCVLRRVERNERRFDRRGRDRFVLVAYCLFLFWQVAAIVVELRWRQG